MARVKNPKARNINANIIPNSLLWNTKSVINPAIRNPTVNSIKQILTSTLLFLALCLSIRLSTPHSPYDKNIKV